MLKYRDIPKNIRTNNALESLNGRIKKIASNKTIVSWLEYMDIILKIENHYKEKIINLESLDNKNTNTEHPKDKAFHINKKEDLLEPYFSPGKIILVDLILFYLFYVLN
jgi:hypothetical protein